MLWDFHEILMASLLEIDEAQKVTKLFLTNLLQGKDELEDVSALKFSFDFIDKSLNNKLLANNTYHKFYNNNLAYYFLQCLVFIIK